MVVKRQVKAHPVALSAELPRHAEVLVVSSEVTELCAGFSDRRENDDGNDEDDDDDDDDDDVHVVGNPDAITTGPEEPVRAAEFSRPHIESLQLEKFQEQQERIRDGEKKRRERRQDGDDNEEVEEQACDEERRVVLRHWREMPRHLQFNPHIKTGYRPLTTFVGCIHSLFYLHNETVNILTHGEFRIVIFEGFDNWGGGFSNGNKTSRRFFYDEFSIGFPVINNWKWF